MKQNILQTRLRQQCDILIFYALEGLVLKYSELSYFMALYKVKVLVQGFNRERTVSKETDFAILPLLKKRSSCVMCQSSYF